MARNKKIIVIGGGIGGLATAALLGKDGFEVTLFEKNDYLGGRAGQYKESGFTFDLGPTWYMMPDVFEQFFSLFDKKPSDFYKLIKLDPHYKVFFSSEESIQIKADIKENLALFESIEPGAGKKLQEVLNESKKIYNYSMQHLVRQNYLSLLPFFNTEMVKNILSFHLFKSYHNYIKSCFKDPKLQKILEFSTVFLGGSPFNTPAFYILILHTDFNLHIWHPEGGIYKVIEAVEALCRRYNVVIKKSEPVMELQSKNGKLTAAITARGIYEADIFVCNADYAYCETELINNDNQSYSNSYWQKRTLAPSAFLLYLGLNKKMKNLEHHTLYFDRAWENHFDHVYNKSTSWPKKPSYYLCVPTKTDSSLAPHGNEALTVLVPVSPYTKATESSKDIFMHRTIKHLEELTQQEIANKIMVKKIFTNSDFTSAYNAYKGSAFGIAHTLTQTALFRPNNKSKKLQNLYYVGQYTNPGIGLPPALISSQIVHQMIINDQ